MEMFLTLSLQCKETATEGPCSIILRKVLSLGVETMIKIPKVSILKIKLKSHTLRQLSGSVSFHLSQREQNGEEGGRVLARK